MEHTLHAGRHAVCVFSGLNKLEGLSLGLIELEGNMYSCIHLLYIGPDCLCELMNTINYLCAQTILQFGSKESSDDPSGPVFQSPPPLGGQLSPVDLFSPPGDNPLAGENIVRHTCFYWGMYIHLTWDLYMSYLIAVSIKVEIYMHNTL